MVKMTNNKIADLSTEIRMKMDRSLLSKKCISMKLDLLFSGYKPISKFRNIFLKGWVSINQFFDGADSNLPYLKMNLELLFLH